MIPYVRSSQKRQLFFSKVGALLKILQHCSDSKQFLFSHVSIPTNPHYSQRLGAIHKKVNDNHEQA